MYIYIHTVLSQKNKASYGVVVRGATKASNAKRVKTKAPTHKMLDLDGVFCWISTINGGTCGMYWDIYYKLYYKWTSRFMHVLRKRLGVCLNCYYHFY